MDTDPADLVRSGYDAVSRRYRGDDDTPEQYDRWLTDLLTRLHERGHVLDIGCGCGIPVARRLTAAGHQVTGVDISDVQIERARSLVPDATTYRSWLRQSGLRVTDQQFVPDGDSGHALFWARRKHA